MVDKMKVTILKRGGYFVETWILEKAARLFARDLLGPRLSNKLSLRIELRSSNLRKEAIGQAFAGCRMVAGDRKEYTVRIFRDMNLSTQIQTLAHEIAHVEQYMRGKLKYKRLSALSSEVLVTMWMGERASEAANGPWAQRPWEIEAVEQERRLWALWQASVPPVKKEGPKTIADSTVEEIEEYKRTGKVPTYQVQEAQA